MNREIMWFSLIILGIIGMFFEQTRPISPLLIGFPIGFLASSTMKKAQK